MLRAAIDRSDLGYVPPAPRRVREALAGFAARRLRGGRTAHCDRTPLSGSGITDQ
jgi:hypothetical protein